MFTAYKDAMRRYADFEGRSSRSQYWFFLLVFYIGIFVLYFVLELTDGNPLVIGLLVLHGLGHVIPSIAVTIRRLHDFNASGWFWLLSMVGGIVFMIIVGCIPPTLGPNRFGRPPHESEGEVLAKAFE